MYDSCLRNEGGGAILIVLVILLSLGLLAALWLAVSAGDIYIAAARRGEVRRYYAAEGAMTDVLARLKADGAGAVSPQDLREADPAFASSVDHGVFAGKEYRWQAAFLSDRLDRDGDPTTETVLYNRAFGYDGAPEENGGYPVVGIFLELMDGAGRTSLRADVTPLALSPAIAAAWTGGGELLFDGPVHISGRRRDRDGNDAGGSAVPAVAAGGAVHLLGGAFVEGEEGRPVVSGEAAVVPGPPGEILGGGDSVAGLEVFPPPPVDGRCLDGIFVTGRDFSGPLCGSGVLVVHNPAFDPVRYEASRLYLEEAVETEEFDPAYSFRDPGLQPARIDLYQGGIFRGLVIADAFPFVYDGTRIIGAVVTLSRSPSAVTAGSLLEVLFSGEAIEEASLGPLGHRLGIWSPPGETALPAAD